MHGRVLTAGSAHCSTCCTSAAEPTLMARSCERVASGASCSTSFSNTRLLPAVLRRPDAFSSSRHAPTSRGCLVRCEASEDLPSQETTDVKEAVSGDRLSRTLTGLDALLGIDPEEERKKKEKDDSIEAAKSAAKKAADSQAQMEVTFSPQVLEKLKQAEEERAKEQAKNSAGTKENGKDDDFDAKMTQIIDMAKKLADGKVDSKNEKDVENELFKGVEALMDIIRPPNVEQSDMEVIKNEVFTGSNFYILKSRQIGDAAPLIMPAVQRSDPISGVYVQGTLRMPREEVFEDVYAKLRAKFGDKYELYMEEDLEEGAEGNLDPRGGPRIAFQILDGTRCRPEPAKPWQWLVALGLAAFTAGSCLQLGLVSNVFMLPKETVAWLANPGQIVDPNGGVPGLGPDWDPTAYIQAALPISVSAGGIQLAHELGHRVMALFRKVKLGPSFFIPNGQLGSFGAVTPFSGMVRKRSELFDVAVAGPAAGGIVSAALFVLGIALSAAGSREGLIPVPPQLFEGSLALGSIVQAVFGEGALAGGKLAVHPFLIAGWAGLVSTALNLLPVGSIDGGRIVQGAFGKSALSATSFFTYVGLGLGFLGSGLALPFGLYVLIVQRNPESVLQDNVTPPSSSRQVLAAALVFAAILVLLPMAPQVADNVGQDPGMFL